MGKRSGLNALLALHLACGLGGTWATLALGPSRLAQCLWIVSATLQGALFNRYRYGEARR